MPRGSKPGERRGGRKKGVPNKLTASVKASIEAAYKAIGGDKQLAEWARDNQTEFYTRVLPRIIPKELEHSGDVRLNIEYVEADD